MADHAASKKQLQLAIRCYGFEYRHQAVLLVLSDKASKERQAQPIEEGSRSVKAPTAINQDARKEAVNMILDSLRQKRHQFLQQNDAKI